MKLFRNSGARSPNTSHAPGVLLLGDRSPKRPPRIEWNVLLRMSNARSTCKRDRQSGDSPPETEHAGGRPIRVGPIRVGHLEILGNRGPGFVDIPAEVE